jgi:hypothetical protein
MDGRQVGQIDINRKTEKERREEERVNKRQIKIDTKTNEWLIYEKR